MDGGGRIKHNDNDWKFQKYKGTNLDHDILCESVNTDQEEKEGDVLKGNRIINPPVGTPRHGRGHGWVDNTITY